MLSQSIRALRRNLPGRRTAKRLLNSLQYRDAYAQHVPPGHFYSPIAAVQEVESRRDVLFDKSVTDCPGIDLRVDAQLALLAAFGEFTHDMPFPEQASPHSRYHFDNEYFRHCDGAVLYAMLRRFQPKRVIEVGSGFSSAMMLETDQRFLGQSTQFTFIEPYPTRLHSLLSDADRQRCVIRDQVVQSVELELFDQLEDNDILLIDSSHVVKIGSDVDHLLTHVVPRLKPGVLIHIHDIFWPFEYPEAWIKEGRSWNEAYALKAFLQFNHAFRTELFSSYLAVHHQDAMAAAFPKNPRCRQGGGSFWMRRTS